MRSIIINKKNFTVQGGSYERTKAETVLFVHQTKWQKLLLNQFGNEITLLDAIYKTMRYDLLLFFLVVRINMNCIGVSSFIIQSETIAAIQELLAIYHY